MGDVHGAKWWNQGAQQEVQCTRNPRGHCVSLLCVKLGYNPFMTGATQERTTRCDAISMMQHTQIHMITRASLRPSMQRGDSWVTPTSNTAKGNMENPCTRKNTWRRSQDHIKKVCIWGNAKTSCGFVRNQNRMTNNQVLQCIPQVFSMGRKLYIKIAPCIVINIARFLFTIEISESL